MFSKITREIVTAVKLGGPDAADNIRLASILDRAKAVNLPKDNILAAIAKGSSKDSEAFEEVSLAGVGL